MIPNYPNAYWKSIPNRRKFLDEMKMKFKIKKPNDWGKLRIHDIRRAGGGTLLNGYYEGSLFNCLQTIYPGFYHVRICL